MIYFGILSKQSVLGDAGKRECPACKENSNFQAKLNYRYFHIYYFFSFIVKREYFFQCDNCGHSAGIDAAAARQLFPRDGIPFMYKRGWLLVTGVAAVVLAWLEINAYGDRQQAAVYLNEPRIHDIYLADLAKIEGSGFPPNGTNVAKLGGKAFGAMKLMKLSDQELTFATSANAYNKRSGLERDLSRVGYDPDPDNLISLTREEVRDFWEKGVIFGITRY